MEQTVQRSKQRAHHYIHVDGLNEIVFSGQLLLNGTFFMLMDAGQGLSAWLFMLSMIIWIAISYQGLVPWIRERITYRRTGWVNLPNPPRVQQALFLIMLVMGLGVIALILPFAQGRVLPRWTPLLTGGFLGLALLAFGRGLTRFWGLAGLSVLLGTGITLQPGLSLMFSLALLCMGIGGALLISGSWVLYRYLRHNPPVDEGS